MWAMRPALTDPPATDSESVAPVLAEIAETTAETLQLQDVIARIATAVRRVIPHDNLSVIRLLDDEWAIKHAVTFHAGTHGAGRAGDGDPMCLADDALCRQPMRLSSWSPRLRPR